VIFVTVGTQLPFDRLIKAADALAGAFDVDAFAQIGPGSFIPANMRYSRFVDPEFIDDVTEKSSFVISHAGMGSILTTLSFHRPMAIIPRLAEKGEHRNSHQVSTASRFRDMTGIDVVNSEAELFESYSRSVASERAIGLACGLNPPSDFIEALRGIIFRQS